MSVSFDFHVAVTSSNAFASSATFAVPIASRIAPLTLGRLSSAAQARARNAGVLGPDRSPSSFAARDAIAVWSFAISFWSTGSSEGCVLPASASKAGIASAGIFARPAFLRFSTSTPASASGTVTRAGGASLPAPALGSPIAGSPIAASPIAGGGSARALRARRRSTTNHGATRPSTGTTPLRRERPPIRRRSRCYRARVRIAILPRPPEPILRMPSPALFDLDRIDETATVANLDVIRQANPQRFEMEQLTRIVYVDDAAGEVAGIYDVPDDPFWARGHVPGRPLMPGVMLLEAAAQLCSYFVRRVYSPDQYGHRFFGFGGIDSVKFRGVVLPGQRLLVLGKRVEIRSRRAVFDTQGYVDGHQVFEARITGMWV